jgi:CubicO group peptidase (beta-lactamase class C family)
MKTALFLFLMILSISALAQQQPLQEQLQKILTRDSITGMQIVYSKNNVVTGYNLGKTGIEHDSPVSSNTIFQAASLSKVVLAYIALRYIDRGIISLDTALYKYYRNPRIVDDSVARLVTVRMVLNHTSGFPNWAANPSGKNWARSKLTVKFKPGIAWSYSGEGFVYLQQALETLTGKSLNQLATEEVFEPFKMKQSSYIWEQRFDDSMAYGQSGDGNESTRNQVFVANGAASLITTATDYSTFLQALCIGKGLKPQTLQLLFTDYVVPEWFGRRKNPATAHLGWGLGVGIENNEKGRAIWHWGDNGDFKCFFMAYPATSEILVYMTNDKNGLRPIEEVLMLFLGKQTYWSVKWLN